MTYNEILQTCTEEYILNNKTSNRMLTPETMAKELLENIRRKVELENAVEPRGGKIKMPSCLPDISIARLISEFYPVKRIAWTDFNKEEDSMLSIYQTTGKDTGLYVSNESAFRTLIRLFRYDIPSKNISEIMAMLNEMAPLAHVTKDADLIAVNNGIFDYQKKLLIDFSPDYIFTAKSSVNYNPHAVNPVITNKDDGTKWDVESWFASLSDNPEIVDLLWQVVGAVIRPHVPWDKAVCFYSETGNNGKGTLCELLRQLCGDYAALSFEQFAQPFLLEQLTQVCAVIGDENNTNGYLKCSETLKSVITGDCFTLNGKFKKPMTFRFRGLMVQCVNSLPRFSDKSESLSRRLLMIPFEKCFTGRERKYIKSDYLKRPDVLEYVLYKVLHDTSYYVFDEPTACKDLLDEYKEFNDPVCQFLNEILPELKWDLVPFAFLYALYKAWFMRNNPNGQIHSRNSFKKEVKSLLINNFEWRVSDNPYPTGNLMDELEPLIMEYDLKDWMNADYRGNDIKKICTPSLKKSYRGLLRL